MSRLLLPLVRPGPLLRMLAAAALIAAILGLLVGGSQSWAPAAIPTPPTDKLLHFAVFGSLTAVSWIVFGGTSVLLPVLTTVAIGMADEWMQSMSPGRTSSLHDLAADATGALVMAVMLVLLRLWLVPHLQRERDSAAPMPRRPPPAR